MRNSVFFQSLEVHLLVLKGVDVEFLWYRGLTT